MSKVFPAWETNGVLKLSRVEPKLENVSKLTDLEVGIRLNGYVMTFEKQFFLTPEEFNKVMENDEV